MNNTRRLIQLSWRILELKLGYYRPELVNKELLPQITVPDAEYDKLEDEYRKLCAAEGVEPTAADMVDFDVDRPSCKAVLALYKMDKKEFNKLRGIK